MQKRLMNLGLIQIRAARNKAKLPRLPANSNKPAPKIRG